MQLLDRLKHFVVDNRRNSVLHHKPFAFRYGCPFVNLVADNTLPALTHHTSVDGILKHTGNRCRVPQTVILQSVRIFITKTFAAFVGGGIRNAKLV